MLTFWQSTAYKYCFRRRQVPAVKFVSKLFISCIKIGDYHQFVKAVRKNFETTRENRS